MTELSEQIAIFPSAIKSTSRSVVFAAIAIFIALGAALLAGTAPVGFSIVTVFLFAGPHNWMEGRFFLSQMPARWGPLRAFFAVGILGVVLLTAAFAALPMLMRARPESDWLTASATWNSLLILWVASLAQLRCRHHPKRQLPWIWPAAFALVALVWAWPRYWDVALIYLHPIVALTFLGRMIARKRPEWRGAYRFVLSVAALLGIAIVLSLWRSSPLAGEDMISMRITRHAGSDVLAGVSSHLLVSLHTYLEMLHYGVWLVAIPLVAMPGKPWEVLRVPLARASSTGRRFVLIFAVAGLLVVLTLWAAFTANYPATRDVYFTLAIAHVLAEAPFLLRAL